MKKSAKKRVKAKAKASAKRRGGVSTKRNSAKFERCVKKVKKQGSAISAYAICTAAGTRDNKGSSTRRRGGPSTRRHMRSNPGEEETAAEVYEQFHGYAPREVIEIETPMHVHGSLPGIGKLVKLIIKPVNNSGIVTLSNFGSGMKTAYLCQSKGKHGPQLYIEGGDQSVNLREFGITRPHEHEILGTATWVWYDTEKTHLQPEDGGKAIYRHRFGYTRDSSGRHVRVPGTRNPVIGYDVRNRLLSFLGGTYTIPAEGIDG